MSLRMALGRIRVCSGSSYISGGFSRQKSNTSPLDFRISHQAREYTQSHIFGTTGSEVEWKRLRNTGLMRSVSSSCSRLTERAAQTTRLSDAGNRLNVGFNEAGKMVWRASGVQVIHALFRVRKTLCGGMRSGCLPGGES